MGCEQVIAAVVRGGGGVPEQRPRMLEQLQAGSSLHFAQ